MRIEDRVKKVLSFIGIIGASMMAVVYLITIIVMIQGFQNDMDLRNTVLFAVINAVTGFVIMQFLKIQGVQFARSIPENEEVIKKYYNTKTKDKKMHSIKYYWITTVLKDIFVKALTIAVTTFGVIYIIIEGSKDYHLLLMAFANLIMFVCFGLLSMNSAYDFFNQQHIPYIKERIKEIDKQ